MKNYTKTNIGNEGRIELHEKLSLTGAEISINQLPAGASIPFVHSHKNNEEIYGIIAGKGKAVIDSEEIELSAGDWLKIAPMAKRQFFAANDSELTYICIQVKENSLGGFTADDAVVYKVNHRKQEVQLWLVPKLYFFAIVKNIFTYSDLTLSLIIPYPY